MEQPAENLSLLRANKASTFADYARELLVHSRLALPALDFAPLHVPMERRLQTLSVLFYYTMTLQSIALVSLTVRLGCWPLLVAYVAFIAYDRGHENGGRPREWFKRLAVWRGVAAYFPMQMVREAELDPSKQYMFGYHPHGVIANGAVVGFGTEALGFSELFPGITVRPLTIVANFIVPFYRELVIALGFCGPTKQSINNLFRKGHSCLVVVGGAEESLISTAGSANLILKKRLGFVAIAIKNGANLVPVYAFGENESFDIIVPEKGSPIHRFQMVMKRLFGFTIPLYHGRSIFTYNYGFLPKRGPITIVGKLPPTN